MPLWPARCLIENPVRQRSLLALKPRNSSTLSVPSRHFKADEKADSLPKQRLYSKKGSQAMLSTAPNFFRATGKRMAEGQIFSITYVKTLIAGFGHSTARL